MRHIVLIVLFLCILHNCTLAGEYAEPIVPSGSTQFEAISNAALLISQGKFPIFITYPMHNCLGIGKIVTLIPQNSPPGLGSAPEYERYFNEDTRLTGSWFQKSIPGTEIAWCVVPSRLLDTPYMAKAFPVYIYVDHSGPHEKLADEKEVVTQGTARLSLEEQEKRLTRLMEDIKNRPLQYQLMFFEQGRATYTREYIEQFNRCIYDYLLEEYFFGSNVKSTTTTRP